MICIRVNNVEINAGAPLPEDIAHHLRDVLRVRTGEEIKLLDGFGRARLARIASADRHSVSVEPCGDVVTAPRTSPAVTLFQCIAKPARMDWLLEKAAELDVARIVPILSARVAAHSRKGETPERWRRILDSGLCQSNGLWATELAPVVDWAGALDAMRAFPGKIITGALTPDAVPLRDALAECNGDGECAVLIGPEGDFTPEELSSALALPNARGVSLGERVLRVETAAVFTVSAIRAFLG